MELQTSRDVRFRIQTCNMCSAGVEPLICHETQVIVNVERVQQESFWSWNKSQSGERAVSVGCLASCVLVQGGIC